MQGEELEPARKRAEEFGVKEIYIDDLREEFVRDYVFPMFRCTSACLAEAMLRDCKTEVSKAYHADKMNHVELLYILRPFPCTCSSLHARLMHAKFRLNSSGSYIHMP